MKNSIMMAATQQQPIVSAHPLPISIATPSRDSMTFTSTKGLLNGPGQNNCFLNSAVQVLWHLDIFRRSFRDLSGHACMADSCIFCALKELFSQLQFSNETALPPDALRRALAESFFDQQRFQLGFMDDAAECFENMLLRIHMHIAHGEAEDMCNARHCIPHQKFAMTLVEQSVCNSCGATSEPLSYTQMVHYVSTSTLVYQVRTNRPQGIVEPFGQLLRKAGSMGDVRVCPSSCGAVIQIGRTLMNRPEIVSVGLVWNSERPTLEHIMEVFSTIGTTLRLSEVFNTVVDSRWAETCIHNLVGVVTYYGKHYSTFFFHTKLRVWIYFDDATVREVGPRWDQVVEKCRKGRYQPLLLLYASPDGTPVNTDNAPKAVTPFYEKTSPLKKQPQSASLIRRSVTPSPEKPVIGNTRRAITPNPDRPPPPRPYNEYQNLSVIQNNLYQSRNVDVVDGKQHNIHRTLSNGSSSGTEMCFRDYLNVPRTRDSGNWSSDRNSASSASSTTMENPYLYLIGKVHETSGGVPPRNESSSSNSSGVYDVGYDSYSLSSNDSSTMTTIQHLMKMGHLAKIPEDYNTTTHQVSQSCDVLCNEADELLVKSRQLEDDHDLVLALALCNAAATKARAAMDAPYNNPQTLTLARMKHNTCIMRARSLHRRMTQNSAQNMLGKEQQAPEVRHTREGSSGSGKHSRQSSRDKGQHSRQNSKELLTTVEKQPTASATKNIEIYATLPKKKDLKSKISAISFGSEDADYVVYDKPPGRESRSIFSRNKNKEKSKRSRSEDRNKHDLSLAPEVAPLLPSKKEENKGKEKGKKQHKIRRKLLMGGLIRRKNRSMPDLTDAASSDKEKPLNEKKKNCSPNSTMDDSSVGLKALNESAASMCGYLSEGHLEFSGNNTNPNLERSKLMRKSFHCSAGKILTAAKVPPPPPLRTTSQLSTSKLNCGEVEEEHVVQRPQYPLPNEAHYSNYTSSPPSNLPYYMQQQQQQQANNMVVTRADVHHEQEEVKHYDDSGVDEVDCCLPARNLPTGHSFDLPPYPSPLGSVVHSRQASEEFPPPPPPLDLSSLDEKLVESPAPSPPPPTGSLLAQLQNKRQEILSQESGVLTVRSSGDTWLKELQAKQAALRMKKSQVCENSGIDTVQKYNSEEGNSAKVTNSVKDLANKFETIQVQPLEVCNIARIEKTNYNININNNNSNSFLNKFDSVGQNGVLTTRKREEVEPEEDEQRNIRAGKKKSVSFCDQVILVATAEEQEDDSYIPNPILERVLRSAMNKPETAAIRQEVLALRQQEHDEIELQEEEEEKYVQHYVRRNSVENLLQQQQQQVVYGTSPQLRQSSPYQRIPQNSPIYVSNAPASPGYLAKSQNCYYNQQQQQQEYRNVRQSPLLYNGAVSAPAPLPVYQHPPSPVPSSAGSSNYNYQQQNLYASGGGRQVMQSPYEGGSRVQYVACQQVCDVQNNYSPPYQQVPGHYYHHLPEQNGNVMRHVGNVGEAYQRVPPPHMIEQQQHQEVGYHQSQMSPKYSPYMHALPPKQLLKKSVSFEPGTKGGCESPTPKAVVTPIMVNNVNTAPTKNKCNLCRKKNVVSSNAYCTDCEFYMSRFKQKR